MATVTTAGTGPGSGPGTSATAGHARWQRRPGPFVRLLSRAGPPLAVAACFVLGWQAVSQWPEARTTGDTSFTWMPGMALMVCGVALLLGLAALSVPTARAAALSSTALWLGTAWLFPAGFVGDGFPESARATMFWWSVLSLLPTVLVWGWAAGGRGAGDAVEPPSPAGPPAGWYDIPGGPAGQLRWWDGAAWTAFIAPSPVPAPSPDDRPSEQSRAE